jgi:hypothetical protein
MTADVNTLLRLTAETLAGLAQEREALIPEYRDIGAEGLVGFHAGYAEGLRYAADVLTELFEPGSTKPRLEAVK